MSYYSIHTKYFVAVDCIIFGFDAEGLKLLLQKRGFEPAKGKWSLMGGFLKNDEGSDEAAARVLRSHTGLNNVYLDQLAVFAHPQRDPGDRVISVAYYSLININNYDKDLVKRHNAHWLKYNELPELIFDHSQMVAQALNQLRKKAATEPIGFNLLPPKFTLTQLQQMYEVIFQKELDKRNFRKKILQMDVLEKLEEKDKTTSKRGAFLYRFNASKYEQLLQTGSSFGI